MKLQLPRRALAGVVVLALTGACGGGDTPVADAGSAKVGIDLPRADSDFWNAYAKYVPTMAKGAGVEISTPTNSQNDVTKLVANVQALRSQGAKGIIFAPQDTGAIVSVLGELEAAKIPVVSVDTRPDKGKVFMVVRADNRAYGEKACTFIGDKLKGKGNVVEFQGALSSINGRDRSEAFGECMKKKYPGIKVFAEPTEWQADKASAALQTILTKTGNQVDGIYMQAGGVFLAPTLALLKSKGLLKPPSDPNHIVIVSNDGISQELDAIRRGDIDATVSQPADLYAKYAFTYIKAALDGKTFQPGPTDHGSTIIMTPSGNLEDQLPAPLVTKENVDDKSLWGNGG